MDIPSRIFMMNPVATVNDVYSRSRPSLSPCGKRLRKCDPLPRNVGFTHKVLVAHLHKASSC